MQELKQFSSKLFAEIDEAPGCFGTETNPIVAPIHSAWEAVRKGEVNDADLKKALESPHSFVEEFAPKNTKHEKDQILRGLAHRVGIFMDTDQNDSGIQKITKKGMFASKHPAPTGPDWEKTHSDEWQDTYVRKEVLEEVRAGLNLDLSNIGFHATTSKVLSGVERRKALVSSTKIKEDGETLKSGESLGSRFTHNQVYVDPDGIQDGYGSPAWFDEHEVVFGVDLTKQVQYVKARGQKMGTWSMSEGYEVGQEVPLENLKVISVPAAHLKEVKKWAEKNCPGVPVVSREALELKRGR